MHPALQLQQLLRTGQIVMAPGAPDALTARLVQKAGFPAIYMTGFGATASRLGTPDIGLLTQTEMTTHARDMARVADIPIIADADTGYGGPSNIHRTVREYIQAGVAAIHLEDQVAPKRCGQMAGIRLMDAQENVRRLQCAVAARGSDPMLVIGRTDALPAAGIDEAVRRAHLYQDAGIDLVFVDGIKKIAEVEAVAKRVQGPKVVSIVDGNETTALTAAAPAPRIETPAPMMFCADSADTSTLVSAATSAPRAIKARVSLSRVLTLATPPTDAAPAPPPEPAALTSVLLLSAVTSTACAAP